MNLTTTSQAILLLTSHFSSPSSGDVKPLTNGEWGRFASWLKSQSSTPADLLSATASECLSGWHDAKITQDRLKGLLNRGHSLALALEKWQRAGLWVMTRSDSDYPRRLKQQLKAACPPILFGCGERTLLNQGGLAVVGSRDAAEQDLHLAQQLGEKAAHEEIAIVSGAARGIDETAMLAAMNSGGKVIGVVADGLLKAATSAKWRPGLMTGKTVLISPFYPESGFSKGQAMGRNRYIYCLADIAMVVCSGKTGGTLAGAQENMKHQWVPLWVNANDNPLLANQELIQQGANAYRDDRRDTALSSLLVQPSNQYEAQPDLFTEHVSTNNVGCEEPPPPYHPMKQPTDFYHLFMQELPHLAAMPITAMMLADALDLHPQQVETWLERATQENRLIKSSTPPGYKWREPH